MLSFLNIFSTFKLIFHKFELLYCCLTMEIAGYYSSMVVILSFLQCVYGRWIMSRKANFLLLVLANFLICCIHVELSIGDGSCPEKPRSKIYSWLKHVFILDICLMFVSILHRISTKMLWFDLTDARRKPDLILPIKN